MESIYAWTVFQYGQFMFWEQYMVLGYVEVGLWVDTNMRSIKTVFWCDRQAGWWKRSCIWVGSVGEGFCCVYIYLGSNFLYDKVLTVSSMFASHTQQLGIACLCYGSLKTIWRAVTLDLYCLESWVLGVLRAKHGCEINVTHGSWSFCVSAWLLCSSNHSLLPYIGNMIKCDRGYKEKCNKLFKRKICIPTGSLLVLFVFIGLLAWDLSHEKS